MIKLRMTRKQVNRMIAELGAQAAFNKLRHTGSNYDFTWKSGKYPYEVVAAEMAKAALDLVPGNKAWANAIEEYLSSKV